MAQSSDVTATDVTSIAKTSDVIMTTLSAVEACLETRYWFYFLASSLIVFFIGIIAILGWRILDHYIGGCVRSAGDERKQDTTGSGPRIGLVTRIKWRCQKLISGQTIVGRIMVTLSCALSIGSLIIYMIDASNPDAEAETCIPWKETISQQVDFAFNMFFLLYFFIRLVAANDKLAFWLDINSLVDYFTIPPVFVGMILNRQWLGLRFLRAIRLMSIPDILQYLSILRTSNAIRFAQLVTIFLSVWFAAAGFVHLVELTGDPWLDFANKQDVTYWECAYFTIVTMSTVGYGDIYCHTGIGRTFIVLFIFGALAMFASFIPAIAEIVGRRQRYGGFYERSVGIRHIVLCGHITYDSVQNFLRDFLHEDRRKNNVKCIFLDNKRPDLELEALFKRHFTKVDFYKGSIMNTRDLERVKLQFAEACLIMANPHSADPDSEDASNIMRVISVKNYCSYMRVIVQLIRFNNKAFCVNLPSWSPQDQVICLSEMKLGFMASGCLAPGFSTLLANLFVMRSYKQSSKRLKWQEQYLEGAGMEVYAENFSPAFHGLPFPIVAEKCFVHLKLLLIAISIPPADGQLTARVILNPSTRRQSPFIIDADTKGFFMCQSDDEAKRVVYYCNACHYNIQDISKMSECACTDKGHFTEAINSVHLSSVTIEVNDNVHQYHQMHPIEPHLKKQDDQQSVVAVTEMFESTGLFHWCPKRLFESSILSHDRNRDIVKHLKEHVVICCFSDGSKSPLLGMCNFVMPLRASNLRYAELRPVVILGDEHFMRREWPSLCNFPLVYVKLGSPLNRFDLRAVKVNRCHMCVILTTNETSVDDPTLIDKESILCSLNIKTMNFQPLAELWKSSPRPTLHSLTLLGKDPDTNGVHARLAISQHRTTSGAYVPMLTELANDYNAQFLDQDDDDDPDVPLYMTQPFACGRAFAASVLDSLMSTTFFNPELLNLIRTLVMGGDAEELEQILAEGVGLIRAGDDMSAQDLLLTRDRCHITLLSLEDNVLDVFVGGTYGDLVVGALRQRGILCLGLYRLIDPRASHGSYYRYVMTNPSAELTLLPSDKVYCVKPFAMSTMVQQLQATTDGEDETLI